MTLTREEIAEKVLPNVSTSPQKRKHKELTSLIKERPASMGSGL